jgi:E-phenylitaconyl-CoA hydratase
MALVEYELSEHVATLTLNRPEVLNALSTSLLTELGEAFRTFRSDPDARVAIVTGAGGRAFSTGGDLKEMSTAGPGGGTHQAARVNGFPTLLQSGGHGSMAMPGCWKPIIAAIDGYCLAGGLELALTADLRLCTPASTFGLTEVARGIIAGGGGTQRLARAIPIAVAMDLLLTARHMSADEALSCGLVNRIVEQDQLATAARELARAIAAHAPLAVQATKEAVMRGRAMSLEDGLRLESFMLQMLIGTEDAAEGPRAFADKRPPVYVGR